MSRINRAELFMSVAKLYGLRSTCPRAEVGVVAVRDGRIVAAGYVGAPSGLPHCLEVGCEAVDGGCARTVHAEANMIAWAAREGISLKGTDVFCTHSPCYRCAQLIGNLGIRMLIWDKAYRLREGLMLLSQLGVEVYSFDSIFTTYGKPPITMSGVLELES